MEVIPKPKEGTMAVFKLGKEGKIEGEGNDNYLCGACGNIICKNVNRGQLINLVFVCPNCGSYNFLKGI